MKFLKTIARKFILLFGYSLGKFMTTSQPNVSFLLITYYGRFDNFKKIIKRLNYFYSNNTKIICVNGRNDDPEAQIKFLHEIDTFLKNYPNIKLVKNEVFTCQSKLWNLGLTLSPTNKVLILNDSVEILGPFVSKEVSQKDFVKINNSYSNYLISQRIISQIGWYDENFIAGASETDGDIETRLVQHGLPINIIRSPFIYWQKFENKVTWDKKLGGVENKKTSHYNKDYYLKKWNFTKEQVPGSVFVPITTGYVSGPNPGYETPNPYPDILNEWTTKHQS